MKLAKAGLSFALASAAVWAQVNAGQTKPEASLPFNMTTVATFELPWRIAFLPDGKMLITSSSDGSIRFRSAATLDPVAVIEHQPDWVEALSVSPDGTRLAAGRYNGTLSLFDMKSFKEVMGPWVAFSSPGSKEKGLDQTASR